MIDFEPVQPPTWTMWWNNCNLF